jgi:peroxiredoxin
MKIIYSFIFSIIISASANAQLAVGKQAPDFTLMDTAGKTISLSDFKGKTVLLDFWASWCPNCRKAHPGMIKIYNQFKERGLVVIGVSIDVNKDKWMNAIKKDNLPYLQLNDPKGWEAPSAVNYLVEAIPATFLIDKNGIIVLADANKKNLTEKIDLLLK